MKNDCPIVATAFLVLFLALAILAYIQNNKDLSQKQIKAGAPVEVVQ